MNLETFLEQKITFKYHNILNKKFWEGDQLKSEVRMKLILIAKAWSEFANIPKSAIKDIIFVGGNANYNYTKYSDIDLHLVVNKKELPDCPDLIDDYLRDKKQLWALTHDIKIYGHTVELYAEEEGLQRPSNQGVYSIKYKTWLVPPKKQNPNIDTRLLKRKTHDIMDMIDVFISGKSNDIGEMTKLKEKLRTMRSVAIQRGGEFSLENLVFKELRNNGYLNKFSEYINSKKVKELSL
jgi:hypothetical protein